VSAPDKAAAEAAAALLQEYQQQEQQQQQDEASAQQQQMAAAGPGLPVISSATGGVGGVGVDESDMALVLQALNDHDTMSFVKLVSVCVGGGWGGGEGAAAAAAWMCIMR
jgi:uncharacterized protein (UPF0303 family)